MVVLHPQAERWVSEVVDPVVSRDYRKATKYVDPSFVVKASVRHRPRKARGIIEVVLTMGRPNYAERRFIRAAKKAGTTFPVEAVQLRGWN